MQRSDPLARIHDPGFGSGDYLMRINGARRSAGAALAPDFAQHASYTNPLLRKIGANTRKITRIFCQITGTPIALMFPG